jgi:anti-sigma28 factor (negative regulator of flagellin synthesis)
MKAGSIGTYLHLVCIEPGEKTEAARERDVFAIDWADPVTTLEDQDVSEHGVHLVQWWADERDVHIRMLRARVQAGTYRVDSVSLAERLLDTTRAHNEAQ